MIEQKKEDYTVDISLPEKYMGLFYSLGVKLEQVEFAVRLSLN